MATYKRLDNNDVKTTKSTLNQLVDIVQEDVSGSATRRKYQVFVTGGIGPGVTSSLFQTVYDQDFSLQTSNPIFDMTVGLYDSGSTVTDTKTGEDSAGKLLFPSSSMMMREKVDVYRQFAQILLGGSTTQFTSPFGGTETTDGIDEALFLSFKRLFARDKIKRETFAMRFYQSASDEGGMGSIGDGIVGVGGFGGGAQGTIRWMYSSNIFTTSTGSAKIFTDFGSSTQRRTTFGGEVGNIVDSSDTSIKVGVMFYDAGIAVLDLKKICIADQIMSGVIPGMNARSYGTDAVAGQVVLGSGSGGDNPNARFIPDFMTSASIDTIVDHIGSCRFQSGSLTAVTFQNNTNINSTLIFCRATADEFNYSSNPTYTNTEDRIRVIDEGQEDVQRSFTFPTTIGLYDSRDNLLAVAKMSRPIEKNDEKDLTIRVRLDF
ncbi:MAG: hypothetical protein CMB80_15000 [Flammeovirgaceae bacterium]|nr:hypothetical protein [Flammeovirgaceae bacterium]